MESIYRRTGLTLKRCSRPVVFLPSDPQSAKISLPISKLTENTCDIWVRNLYDRYISRPYLHEFENMCFADFASKYRIICTTSNSDDAESDKDNPEEN